ncbi:ATP-binding protein [uncultured Dokdonia sp.]|uniref:AlbA family DNA-binding domain-containing protein n=1 Tax=uncultured Dokdonia sp. TaxID=575653 RepID=UPI0026072051|nr:ATP-binding protein [uncultured Dokdonia sp.]
MEIEELNSIIGKPESEVLEYKTSLPPSKNMAQLICSFANTSGGYIILGVTKESGRVETIGLSQEFRSNAITRKAIDQLTPKPEVNYGYVTYNDKNLFVIQVKKSESELIFFDNKAYQRTGSRTTVTIVDEASFDPNGYKELNILNNKLINSFDNSTNSKIDLLNHYKSVLKIIDNSRLLLYPVSAELPTTNSEGKILTRILYSSYVDTFEGYLSDLLYEIYITKPDTLREHQEVTVKEVLNCSDIEEFVRYIAKKKIGKLQRGSVKGFIKDNIPISSLNIITEDDQDTIEKILQIRHLFSHRNGIVDEKFLKYFQGNFQLNSEFELSIKQIIEKMEYLLNIIEKIDKKAIDKFRLSTL